MLWDNPMICDLLEKVQYGRMLNCLRIKRPKLYQRHLLPETSLRPVVLTFLLALNTQIRYMQVQLSRCSHSLGCFYDASCYI